MEINRKYRLVQGNECLSACLGNYFNYEYPEITGNEIIILGGGLGIIYDSEKNVLSSKMYQSNFVFLDRYGISYVHDKFNSEMEAKQELQQAVNAQKKICTKVQAELLPYSSAFNQPNDTPHFINILGFNEKQVYICDGYVPKREVSTHEGWMEYHYFMKAWKEKDYEFLIINDISMLDNGFMKKELKTYIKKELCSYIYGGRSDQIYFGQDAIIKFIDNLLVRNKEDDIREYVLDMNYQLKVYGFISLKRIIYDALYHNYEDIKIDIMEYQSLIAEWNNFCMLLVKCAFSKKTSIMEEMHKKMLNIVNRENKVIKKILVNIETSN